MRTPPTNGRRDGEGSDNRRGTTERRILDGAIELVLTGTAWHQLGIRQIADRAEISRTAFYDFFGSKNEVLEHAIRGLHEDLGRALLESSSWRADDDRSPVLDLLRLRALLATIASFHDSHGALYRAFLDAARQDAAIDHMWHDLMGAYIAVVVRAIDDARAKDAAAPAEPSSEALARVLVLMTERTMLLLGRDTGDGDTGAADLVDALALVWERSVFGAPSHPSST